MDGGALESEAWYQSGVLADVAGIAAAGKFSPEETIPSATFKITFPRVPPTYHHIHWSLKKVLFHHNYLVTHR